MSETHEKILDAFLDEMLSGSRPGRQATDIVRAAQVNSSSLNPAIAPDSKNNNPSLAIVTQAVEQAKVPDSSQAFDQNFVAPTRIIYNPPRSIDNFKRQAGLASKASNWLSIVGLAVALLVATSVIAWFLLSNSDEGRDSGLAQTPSVDVLPDVVPDVLPLPGDRSADETRIADSRKNISPSIPVLPRDDDPVDPDRDPVQPPSNHETGIASRTDIPNDQLAIVLPPPFVRNDLERTPPLSPVDFTVVSNRILAEGWQAAGLQPVGELEIGTWTTRLLTRLLGRTPTADELTELAGLFAAARPLEQLRREIVEWTLADDARKREFAAHWGRVLAWKMLGISNSMQTTDADMLRTRDFLESQIGSQQPLDETVYRMLSVVGSTDPVREDFDPAASYLIGVAKRFGKLEQASAHIAGTFAGQSMQCAVCHDSGRSSDGAIAGATQKDFFEYHSFFAQLKFEATEGEQFFVVNRNYLPNAAEQQVEAPVFYTAFDGTSQQAYPQFGSLQPAANGFVAKVDRRSLLAAAIVESPEFQRSIVDLVWTSLLNVPLTGIDGEIQTASSEMLALRNELGKQFAANQFDIRWLVESIVLSKAFAVGVGSESQLAANNPFIGQTPRFNQFYQRIENRRSSIASLTILANAYRSRNPVEAQSAGLLARIDGINAILPANSSIQANLPTNDNQWATSALVESQLERIAASKMATDKKIEHLVQAALGRPALAEEIEQCVVVLDSANDQKTALQDIWWGLMNSLEYQLPLGVR